LTGNFCPAAATLYTDEGEIWHRSIDCGSTLISNIIKNIQYLYWYCWRVCACCQFCSGLAMLMVSSVQIWLLIL